MAENRPGAAVDSCFATGGSLLAAGEDVWDGMLDDEPDGACTQEFEIFSSSRRQAGGPYEGGVFKCQLKPVSQAVADGDYGEWTPTAAAQEQLEEIFPTGVCDWSKPDAGRPDSPPVQPLPPEGPGHSGTAPPAPPVPGTPKFTG